MNLNLTENLNRHHRYHPLMNSDELFCLLNAYHLLLYLQLALQFNFEYL